MKHLSGAVVNTGTAVGQQGNAKESSSIFPKYPSYKISGVEWVDTLPTHWGKVSLKWISRIYAGGTPDKSKIHYWENGTIPWLNSGAVNQALILEPSNLITAEAFKSCSARWIPAGALVIALAGQGKTKGMVAQLAIESTCNQSMAAIIPEYRLNPRYLYWWLSNNYQNIRNMAGGDLRDGLNLELIGDIPALIPSEAEQIQIARFLDDETARIDALIEEQLRLIELLKEKRQATISRAVTKGLDSTVPMKDSGVEWLGEVPAHWYVKRLKYLVPAITVGIVIEPSKYYVEEGIPALRSLNVKPGAVVSENLVYLSPESNDLHSKSKIYEGDIVAVRSGQPGTAAIVPPELNGANCIDLIVIRKPLEGCSTFIFWYLSGDAALKQFSAGTSGAIQQHFNISAASELIIAWPPTGEQQDINEYLARISQKLDRLIIEAGESKSLLLERRSALISAAVTGKIDVRGWRSPNGTPSLKLEKEAV